GACDITKSVKVVVQDKVTVDISPANIANKVCKGNQTAFTATGLPPGGTYSWSVTGPAKFNSGTNTQWAWVEVTGQGDITVSVTYTFQGETATNSVSYKGREVKEVQITANPADAQVDEGTAITYTAKVIDMDGNDITSEVPLKWERTCIRIGVPQGDIDYFQ